MILIISLVYAKSIKDYVLLVLFVTCSIT